MACHVTHMGYATNAYTVLVRNSEGMRLHDRHSCR